MHYDFQSVDSSPKQQNEELVRIYLQAIKDKMQKDREKRKTMDNDGENEVPDEDTEQRGISFV